MAAPIAQPERFGETLRVYVTQHGDEVRLMCYTPCVAPFTKDCVLVTEDHDGITIMHSWGCCSPSITFTSSPHQ